jgi:ClpX C4-type zinc finger
MEGAMKNLCCSFCLKPRSDVKQLVAGPGVHICDACVGLCNQLLTGKTAASFASWDSLSDDDFLATVPAAASAVNAAEDRLRDQVALLRRRGISWNRIATVLGVTRQAVWERFSSDNE